MEETTRFGVIKSWETLGNFLHVRGNIMSYAYRETDKLRRKIKIKKRTVYSSKGALLHVQHRLAIVFREMVEKLPPEEKSCILAYRRGLNPVDVLKRHADSWCMIKADICGYYDNISYEKIVNTLTAQGFAPRGARLVAHFSTVWNGKFLSLQQGSPCSPAMANLVGNRYFDKPILEWLKQQGVTAYYYRYSDNIVLFVPREAPAEFLANFKAKVKEIAGKNLFRTHSWATIKQNNPVRHQEFLGVVLNKVARPPKSKRDSLRGALYSIARSTRRVEGMRKFLENRNFFDTDDEFVVRERFRMVVQGHISYINSIDYKTAKQLEKLFFAIALGVQNSDRIRGYKNDAESVDEYIAACRRTE